VFAQGRFDSSFPARCRAHVTVRSRDLALKLLGTAHSSNCALKIRDSFGCSWNRLKLKHEAVMGARNLTRTNVIYRPDRSTSIDISFGLLVYIQADLWIETVKTFEHNASRK
jgi:hypothetical protein